MVNENAIYAEYNKTQCIHVYVNCECMGNISFNFAIYSKTYLKSFFCFN